MPSSGSGVGTPIVIPPVVPPVGGGPYVELGEALPRSCVSPNRYAKIIQQKECAFWGVNNPDDPEPGCRDIWTLPQRDEVMRYLAEAQEEIEQQVDFYLCPTWVTDEQHPYRQPVFTSWGKVIAGGVRAETVIQAGAAVDHSVDPAIIGPIVTTLTSTSEIKIFYPGSEREIEPKKMLISGGNLTVWIPRCRMVKPDLMDNPPEGLDYYDTANFLATVDVKRVYNDPSTNATLIWPHQCSAVCGQAGCSAYTATGCEYVRLPEIGSLDVTPATYSNGQWVSGVNSSCCRGRPQFVKLNYYAGAQTTKQMEDTIIRLAHSKMPDEFCGCEVWTRLWRRDRNVPEILTRERLNNPFGLADGAFIAFSFTRQFRLVRGDVI